MVGWLVGLCIGEILCVCVGREGGRGVDVVVSVSFSLFTTPSPFASPLLLLLHSENGPKITKQHNHPLGDLRAGVLS